MTATDAHDHPDFLAHHFDTPQQQFDAGKLGMWMFLATEVLLFGGLFVGYAVWRGGHPELFKYGSQFLDTTMGATNTVVLILSSLTMAAAVTTAQRNHRKATAVLLLLTLAGAATFMVIKYFEYTHKFAEGWYPGLKFYEPPGSTSHTWADYPEPEVHPIGDEVSGTIAGAESIGSSASDRPEAEPTVIAAAAVGPSGISLEELQIAEFGEVDHDGMHEDHVTHPLQDPNRPDNAHMFFNIYFLMTGLHGIHVIIGGIVIVWLLIGTLRGKFSSEYFTPVDLGGLYWHIVDLIWIFLFPLFYLI